MLLAVLLRLAAVRLCQLAAAQQQAVGADLAIVRSASELGDALRNGRAHIEIQNNLDLTAAPWAAGTRPSKVLYRVAASTQSIRVWLSCTVLCSVMRSAAHHYDMYITVRAVGAGVSAKC